MHERLELQIGTKRVDRADLRQRKFAGEHDALRALLPPERGSVAVRRIGLRGDVQRQIGRDLAGQKKGARIRDERRIRTDLPQIHEIVGQRGEIRLPCKDIGGDVHLFPAGVRVGNGFFHLACRKIVRKRAKRKLPAAEVNGVRPEVQRRL